MKSNSIHPDEGRRLAHAAFLAPAGVVAALRLYNLLGPTDAPATVLISLALACLWIGAASLMPSLRLFLTDLGFWLAQRVSAPLLLVLFLLAGIKATMAPVDPFWAALATWLFLLFIASARIAMATRSKPFMMALFALGLSGIMLIGCDLLVRYFVLPHKTQNSIFIEHDPLLGWKLRPSFSVERINDRYQSRETINRIGFRFKEVPGDKSEGVLRILILGDSHTEGYTVNDGETYGELLEAYLSGTFPVEVIPLGVGGYSTDQELLTYLHHGRPFDPDVVILQFAPNDVKFNMLDRYWRGMKPRFKRHGDLLLLEGVPVPDMRSLGLSHHFLLKHSAMAIVVDVSLGRLSVVRDVEDQDPEEAWRVTELLLRDLNRIVRKDGASLLVFNAVPDVEDQDVRLRNVLSRHEIPFLDINPAFGGRIEEYRVPEGSRHWNSRGHDAVARYLAELLAPMLQTTMNDGGPSSG